MVSGVCVCVCVCVYLCVCVLILTFDVGPLPFFPVSLAKDYKYCLSFQRTWFLFHWSFLCCFKTLFISVLIIMISFLLLTLGFVCKFFSSYTRCKVMLFEIFSLASITEKLLRTAFAASHRFWVIVFLFSFVSRVLLFIDLIDVQLIYNVVLLLLCSKVIRLHICLSILSSHFLFHYGWSQSIEYLSLCFTAGPSPFHSVPEFASASPNSTRFLVSGVCPLWVRLFQSLAPGFWVGPDLVALDSGKMSDPRESHSVPPPP